MARTMIRCRYTGNYIISNQNAGASTDMFSGRIFCPYCNAEHVWSSHDASNSGSGDEPRPSTRRKALVRQAS